MVCSRGCGLETWSGDAGRTRFLGSIGAVPRQYVRGKSRYRPRRSVSEKSAVYGLRIDPAIKDTVSSHGLSSKAKKAMESRTIQRTATERVLMRRGPVRGRKRVEDERTPPAPIARFSRSLCVISSTSLPPSRIASSNAYGPRLRRRTDKTRTHPGSSNVPRSHRLGSQSPHDLSSVHRLHSAAQMTRSSFPS
jgi:hypothetical protein